MRYLQGIARAGVMGVLAITGASFFSASTTSSERGRCVAIHCAKHAPATLIQGVAPALCYQLFQQPSHGL
jgi:hypothetical protein